MQPPKATGNSLANSLLNVRALLEGNFGVETAFVYHQGAYDTHVNELATHQALMTDFDQAIEAFLFGTIGGTAIGVGPMSPALANQTIIMTTSEFGRRIGENGTGATAGTDHGAAGPLMLIGPPAGSAPVGTLKLSPGLHGDHPNMGTTILPADNLAGTTELRRVYQSVLESWLSDPDPLYSSSYSSLPGLFVTA